MCVHVFQGKVNKHINSILLSTTFHLTEPSNHLLFSSQKWFIDNSLLQKCIDMCMQCSIWCLSSWYTEDFNSWMCDEAITPHNHSVLYSNIALQADIDFELQAQVGIFLTLHILKYSIQVNIYVLNYFARRHQSTYLQADLIFPFLICLDSISFHFIRHCNVFYSKYNL